MKEYLVQIKHEHDNNWFDSMKFYKEEVLDSFLKNLATKYSTSKIRIMSREIPEFEFERDVQ